MHAPEPPHRETQFWHVARVSQHATPALPHCALFSHERAQNWFPRGSAQQSYPLPQQPEPLWQPCQGAASFATQRYVLSATMSLRTAGAQAVRPAIALQSDRTLQRQANPALTGAQAPYASRRPDGSVSVPQHAAVDGHSLLRVQRCWHIRLPFGSRTQTEFDPQQLPAHCCAVVQHAPFTQTWPVAHAPVGTEGLHGCGAIITHCPAVVHICPVGHVPHEPPIPSGPHARPAQSRIGPLSTIGCPESTTGCPLSITPGPLSKPGTGGHCSQRP